MKKLFMLITLVLSTSLVFAASLKDSLRNFISEGKYIQITLKGNLASANAVDMTVIIPRETVASIGLTKATKGEKSINMVVLTTTSVIDPLLMMALEQEPGSSPFTAIPIPTDGTRFSTDAQGNLYISADLEKIRSLLKLL